MPREGDERAVTVVIGAVLMFGILVTSLAMYQVNVVPDQNQGTEWDHHQEVTADLLDLRNAVVNAGYENSTRETSVALGTQYESRTFSINPPDPQGTIRTNSTGNPQVQINTSDEDYSFDTSYIEYEPGYHEYDAPTTVIEHGLVYDEHGHVNITRDAGSVISDERIVIPLIEGDLSESSRSTASITVETVDVYHVSSDVTEIRLPTNAFEAWNESYDVSESSGNAVLSPDDREVYVAQIAVGDDRAANKDTRDNLSDFGDSVTTRGSSSETNEFELAWEDDSVTGSPGERSVELTATIDEDVENARADFSYSDESGIVDRFEPTEIVQFQNGKATVEVDISSEANDSDTVHVYVSSGGTTKKATLTVDDSTPESGMAVSIQGTNSPVNVGESLDVTAEITNTGDTTETQTITLETDGQQRDSTEVTVAGSSTETVTLTWQTAAGDGGEYTGVVSSQDSSDTAAVTVSDLSFDGGEGTFDRNGDGVDSLVAFDVVNERSDDITLTSVEVVSSSTNANEIDGAGNGRNADPEAVVDVNGDGFADGTADSNQAFAFGERMNFDASPTLAAGSEGRYNIGEFRENGATVDMTGESVTFVLYYVDGTGTERSVELTIDDL